VELRPGQPAIARATWTGPPAIARATWTGPQAIDRATWTGPAAIGAELRPSKVARLNAWQQQQQPERWA
jgi:hypothetical protein